MEELGALEWPVTTHQCGVGFEERTGGIQVKAGGDDEAPAAAGAAAGTDGACHSSSDPRW